MAQSSLWHKVEVLKEILKLKYLIVSTCMFCPQASKASKSPSRVCGSEVVSIIEKKRVRGHLPNLCTYKLMGPDGMSLRVPEELEL